MQPRLSRLGAAVAAALFLAAPRASADTITLQFTGTTNGNAVTYSLNGNGEAGIPGPYFWQTVPGGTPVATFCMDLSVGIPPSAVTFNVGGLTDLPGVTQAKADAITALYGNNYKTAWGSQATASGEAGYGSFQLALWELLYDGEFDLAHPGTNWFANGSFQSSDSAAVGAGAMLDAILNSSGGVAAGEANFASNFPGQELIGLVSPGVQGQIVLPPPGVIGVPAPPGVLLAGVGLVVLAGRARWLRRTATTA